MGPTSSDAEATQRGLSAGTRVFGRYVLSQILGRGGMGVVWRARDEVLGEDVALKFLPDAVRWDPAAYEDLKDETRRARQLTHANIVRIHDFAEDAGSAAISMELVDGVTLTALRLARDKKVLEPAEIEAWLPQLCAALDYAHQEARVVHRDLKPANLMLTRDGRLKIADFGVARGMADSISRVSMMAAGTLVYMSPQQAMGEEPAPTDDLYSLGATCYELLTGKPPFYTGDVRVQLFQRKPDTMTARRQALGVGAGPVPENWERVVAACLAKDPAERPATASEVRVRLAAPARRRRLRLARPGRRGLGVLAAATVGALALGWLWRAKGPAGEAAASAGSTGDDTRALAAWNFDGDTRDSSGRGLDGLGNRLVPTQDRFGRIDRALRFNGNAEIHIPDAPILRWGATQPFTAALWVRQDESENLTGDVWRSDGLAVGSLAWTLGLSNGRPIISLGRVHHEGYTQVEAGERIAPRTWHHLTLTSDGTTLTLFVDGRAAGASALGPSRAATLPPGVEMRIGRPARLSSWALDGALDDLRLWKRVLAPEEIAALASREMPPHVALTRGAYVASDDFAVAIREEFGEQARLLDWSELRQFHADDARGWAEELGLAVSGVNGWLQRDGQRFFDDRRHYYVSRFDGVKPAYYKVHDHLGGMTVVLGSWYGMRAPILVLVPPVPVATEVLKVDAAENVIRKERPFRSKGREGALIWQTRVTPAKGSAVSLRLRLMDGREVRAACETTPEASLALALGPADGTGLSRTVGASFGEFEFTLVVRDGRVGFRAVSMVGRNPIFHEFTRVPELRLSDIAALELSGGPQSGLAVATLLVE